MQGSKLDSWYSLIGEMVVNFGACECITRYLVEQSSGDEGYCYQNMTFEARIDRVLCCLSQNPESSFASRHGNAGDLACILKSLKELLPLRNKIAHNPLEIVDDNTSVNFVAYNSADTSETGDVTYSDHYTFEQLTEKRNSLNCVLRKFREQLSSMTSDEKD